nr:immunoglobulin light chain junction region [Macaca mulatta]
CQVWDISSDHGLV